MPGGPIVKTPRFHAGCLGLIPGWETMNEENEYCGLTPSFAEVPLSDTALVKNDSLVLWELPP